MNIGSIVEAIDQQLALLLEVRELLAEDQPVAARRKIASKPASGSRAAKAATSKAKNTNPPRKKALLLQQELNFERPEHQAGVSSRAVASVTPSIAKQRPVKSFAVTDTVKTKRIPKKRDEVAMAVTATAVPKALTSSIPSGPVVVKPSLVAQEREARSARVATLPQASIVETPSSGLDALIEDVAALAGVRAEGLRRASGW